MGLDPVSLLLLMGVESAGTAGATGAAAAGAGAGAGAAAGAGAGAAGAGAGAAGAAGGALGGLAPLESATGPFGVPPYVADAPSWAWADPSSPYAAMGQQDVANLQQQLYPPGSSWKDVFGKLASRVGQGASGGAAGGKPPMPAGFPMGRGARPQLGPSPWGGMRYFMPAPFWPQQPAAAPFFPQQPGVGFGG